MIWLDVNCQGSVVQAITKLTIIQSLNGEHGTTKKYADKVRSRIREMLPVGLPAMATSLTWLIFSSHNKHIKSSSPYFEAVNASTNTLQHEFFTNLNVQLLSVRSVFNTYAAAEWQKLAKSSCFDNSPNENILATKIQNC